MYIGSSIDMGSRLADHVVSGISNTHLQYAIAKYGLSRFIFYVVELATKDQLLEREQYYLDWLFSLPAHLRSKKKNCSGPQSHGLIHPCGGRRRRRPLASAGRASARPA
jgi:hypothetical protein